MNKEFVKADLKDGMILELRNGLRYLFQGDKVIRIVPRFVKDIAEYDDSLVNSVSHEYDVQKVFTYASCFSSAMLVKPTPNGINLELVWERKDAIATNVRTLFTKKDLEDGMIVERRNGDLSLKVGEYFDSFSGHSCISDLRDDLSNVLGENSDIVKVYKVIYAPKLEDIFDKKCLELIWQRTEVKRMTVEEMKAKLEELTGEKIEVEPTWNEMIGWLYCYCDSQDMDCYKCNLKEKCYNLGSKFENYSLETLKQCYEKVIADGNT